MTDNIEENPNEIIEDQDDLISYLVMFLSPYFEVTGYNFKKKESDFNEKDFERIDHARILIKEYLGKKSLSDKQIFELCLENMTSIFGKKEVEETNFEIEYPSICDTYSNEEYHTQIKAFSSTTVKEMVKGPAFYKANVIDRKDDETKSKNFGSMVHEAILEPDIFDSKYIMGEHSGNSSEAAIEKIKFEFRRYLGYIPAESKLLSGKNKDLDTAIKCRESFFDHPLLNKIHKHKNTKFEICGFGILNGFQCKAKADMIGTKFIADLKTFSVINENKIFDEKTYFYKIKEMNYHISAAFYLDIFRQTNPEIEYFQWIFIQNQSPYLAIYYPPIRWDHDLINEGRLKYSEALQMIEECAKTGYYSQPITFTDFYFK